MKYFIWLASHVMCNSRPSRTEPNLTELNRTGQQRIGVDQTGPEQTRPASGRDREGTERDDSRPVRVRAAVPCLERFWPDCKRSKHTQCWPKHTHTHSLINCDTSPPLPYPPPLLPTENSRRNKPQDFWQCPILCLLNAKKR